jgi:hypothetical protein
MRAVKHGNMLRGRMKWALLGGVLSTLATLPAAWPAPSHPVQVDVKLVIATDVSHSIDLEEAQLQRQGIADTFLDPDVIKAIENGPLGVIAVAMVDWSGYRNYSVVIDWTFVKDKASAAALAERIRKTGVTLGERTSISNAIERSIELLNGSDKEISATRRVVDVSGDGPNNDGVSMQQVHDATANNGIIVNGLPIMDENSDGYFPDLDRYYAACVVAGKGSFQIVVHSYKDFEAAMRRKLVFEVSQNEEQIKQALQELQPNPLLKRIANSNGALPTLPQFQKPPATYPGGCDKYGGWKVFEQ